MSRLYSLGPDFSCCTPLVHFLLFLRPGRGFDFEEGHTVGAQRDWKQPMEQVYHGVYGE